MFDADGRLKVLDFGLVKLFESDIETDKTTGPHSDTAEGKVLGTAAYMSPEQAEGDKVDHRTDVFSLGIIFYEMLTGDKPFTGKTSISTLSSILRDTPTPLSDIKPALPRHLSRILRRCLEKDPGRRFQTVQDLRNDLEDLKEETLSDSAAASTEHAAPADRRPTKDRGGAGSLLKFGVPVVVVAIAAIAFLMMRGPEQVVEEANRTMRLAVLPFENLGNADDEYFADGITDEITAKLSGIDGLAVISRASARKYKGTDKGTQVIGSELGVDYLLEGTIRWDKSGTREKVRITPQLINVADDSHLWAQNYEREIDEIFAVQADIAREIASALDVTIGSGSDIEEATPPTENVAAYQAYLRAVKRDEEDKDGLRLSIELLDRAVAMDPAFAIAWAELSINHSAMYHFGFDRTPSRLESARTTADRAREIAPDLVDAYLAQGYYHYWGNKDYDRALDAIDVAERIVPNEARVVELKSFVLRRQGKVEESLVYMERGFELDPQNAITSRDIAFTLTMLGRYDEAVSFYERAIDISPDFWSSYWQAAGMYITLGDTTHARSTLQRAPGDHDDEWEREVMPLRFRLRDYDEIIRRGSATPDEMLWQQERTFPVAMWVGLSYEQKGDNAEAERYFEMALARIKQEIERLPDDNRLHSALGEVYATLGRKEEAIRHGLHGKELMTVAMDFLNSTERIWDMARIYARVGEPDLALDELEYLLKNPTGTTIYNVKFETGFDRLRDHPRYQDLMSRYALKRRG
jgi:TolB-like protein/Flp pilus assembly protein TadD